MTTYNLFLTLLDVDACKKLIATTPESENVILIPHYSINIASEYEDGELLQAHWEELEEALGSMLEVSDYDDLIAQGELSEREQEQLAIEAEEAQGIYRYELPSHWASYLINGDSSSMTEEEVKDCNICIETFGRCIEVSEESYFTINRGIGQDCSTYKFIDPKFL